MSSKYIAKHIGFPLQDKVKGTKILETLKFLRESQYWDDTRINEYQLTKLKNLIDYAGKNVPYYETLFSKLKLSSKEIHKLEDIQKIPILTKEQFRNNNKELISRNFNAKHIKIGKTGGTTGVPVMIYKDVHNRSFTWASYYRWYEWMGLNYYDRVATFWGAKEVLTKSKQRKAVNNTVNFFQNNLMIDSFNLKEDNMMLIFKNLLEYKPLLLKGYLSALLNFAQFIDKNNLKGLYPLAISSTTETLFPHNREFLSKIFKGPIFNQYGCGEVSAISYECSKHLGLHINLEHVICEVLDQNNKPVINKTGSVVATDLDNYIMPIIRYENGDLAILTEQKCSCGINQPLMKSIEGRSIDTIVLKNGNRVHGVFFTDILYELSIFTNQIQKFQVYQEVPGEIEFRLECKQQLNNKMTDKLYKSLNKFFNKVIITQTDQIHSQENGKFKYIINNISNK